MKNKEGISALLVVYNEEKVIERALKSLYGVVDEIIVIHDGECKDRTVEIAKKYTDKVYVSDENRGMCELHLIDGIEKCNFNWILKIDADEYLSDDLKKNIKDLTSQNVAGYKLLWEIWDGERYITKGFPLKLSLCRISELKYVEFPHREFFTDGEVVETDLRIEHKPLYNNYSLKYVRSKWKKWAKVHADYYLKETYNYYNCTEGEKKSFEKKIEQEVKYSHKVLSPLWFLYAFFKALILRGYYKNYRTWKIPVLQGVYAFYLCNFISEKREGKTT